MSTRFRNLRLAWIGCCIIATVLTIAFWLRSNWYVDEFWITLPAKRGLGFISANNCASIAIQRRASDPAVYIAGYSRIKLKEFHEPKVNTFLGFAAARDGDLAFVNVPYWFLAALFVAGPCLRWRFSLRALVIAMTIVATMMGLVAWSVRG